MIRSTERFYKVAWCESRLKMLYINGHESVHEKGCDQ